MFSSTDVSGNRTVVCLHILMDLSSTKWKEDAPKRGRRMSIHDASTQDSCQLSWQYTFINEITKALHKFYNISNSIMNTSTHTCKAQIRKIWYNVQVVSNFIRNWIGRYVKYDYTLRPHRHMYIFYTYICSIYIYT